MKKLQAYPTLFYNKTTGEPNGHDAGMTLRDYFAAKAIQGILSAQTEMRANGMQNNYSGNQIESLCEESYQIADAMLKQRENE